jgi:hypothetical protein
MYRIRNTTGTEKVYSSLEEFSAAVQRDEVKPGDEIFHTRADKWLDVKTHPHYRIALNHPAGRAEARPAPGAAVGLQTPPGHRPAVNPAGGQTTVRPALNGAAHPPQGQVGPRQKTKELAFLDLDDKPVAKPRPEAMPKPIAPTEADFLVMSSGLEAPVRTTGGFKVTPEDVGLLFEVPEDLAARPAAPADAAKPPASRHAPVARPAPVAPVPPKPEPRAQAVTTIPAVKLPEPTKSTPARQIPMPPAPPVLTAPKTSTPAPVPPVAPEAESKPEPKPVAKLEPKVVADLEVKAEAKPVLKTEARPEPKAEATPEPKAAAKSESAPLVIETAVEAAKPPEGLTHANVILEPASRPPQEDLEAARPSTRTEAAVSVPAQRTVVATATATEPDSRPRLAIGIVTVLVVAAAVMMWRPWKAAAQTASPAAAPSAPGQPGSVQAPVIQAGQPGPTVTPAAGGPAATTPATTPGGTPPAAGAATFGGATRTDPSVKPAEPAPPEETIIAASPRPSFRPEVDLAAATAGIPTVTSSSTGKTVTAAPSELARRFESAQTQAQQELLNRLSVLGFSKVLAPNRLASSDGVSSARTVWNNGADAIRQYRGRIARIADAYEDSLLSSQRSQKWPAEEMRAWSARQNALEPAELTQLSDLMFTQVNEGLELLVSAAGQYQLKNNTIQFRNETTETRYASIRGWVAQRIDGWSALPETTRPVTIAQVLRAVGEGFPATK